ncbi:MAG TPA: N-acetyl-gamma-glutamyl-phosphate reductase [Gammaproteobacteria bacterium]|nr:N-acetyl-gamma-glutamyl-phosphate reductase [Gammaproteobacteria bacterium]
MAIKAGIVGATGYTGVELLRLLAAHPQVEIALITSRALAGQAVSDLFPSLRGVVDLHFSVPDPVQLSTCDVVFFATPNGVAMQYVPKLLEAGVKVIDLAADFRIRDVAVWEQWYGQAHSCPQLLSEAVYGLPETHRQQIREARLVANPGCYPTAVQLGFLPLLEQAAVETGALIADCKSGVSGAGRKAAVSGLLCETSESFKAYAVSGHRHWPEICQGLDEMSEQAVGLTFVPHLVPMIRGIHATLYARLKDPGLDVQSVFEECYQEEPFVDVMPQGSHPETRSVHGANVCRMACHLAPDQRTVVILVVEDNLVKGAAGQAVQNMNLMFAVEESTGLTGAAVTP